MSGSNESAIADQSTRATPDIAGVSNAALLKEFLTRNDAPCSICGYNLRYLLGDVCPECGQQFKLQIGAVHPRFGLFLLCLAPMIMAAGLAITFLVSLIIVLSRGGRTNVPSSIVVYIATGFAEGLAVILLYGRRRGFLARARHTQYLLAAAAWILNIAAVVILMALM